MLAVLVAIAAGTASGTVDSPESRFLFLGSFHMDNPGRDVHNTRADDVLATRRQEEIAGIARSIGRFRPTKVIVEAPPSSQARLDADFKASCSGGRPLQRSEVEQLGFRIACSQALAGVVAVDWNELGPIKDEDSIDYRAAIARHGQQAQRERDQRIGEAIGKEDQSTLDHGTIRDMLLRLNSPAWLAGNAQAYFRIGMYGTPSDAVGANWMMLWYGRNLRIFNNIVRATVPGVRVLVIYGSGHGNLLRQLAADSGQYRVEDTARWLDPPTHGGGQAAP
jgi:hypothetical protein